MTTDCQLILMLAASWLAVSLQWSVDLVCQLVSAVPLLGLILCPFSKHDPAGPRQLTANKLTTTNPNVGGRLVRGQFVHSQFVAVSCYLRNSSNLYTPDIHKSS